MTNTPTDKKLSERFAMAAFAPGLVERGRLVGKLRDEVLIALRTAESAAPTDAAAQKESFVRGEMGMAAADRAQTTLRRPPDTRDGEIAELRARLDTAWEAVRIRDETINATVKTRDATISALRLAESHPSAIREAVEDDDKTFAIQINFGDRRARDDALVLVSAALAASEDHFSLCSIDEGDDGVRAT